MYYWDKILSVLQNNAMSRDRNVLDILGIHLVPGLGDCMQIIPSVVVMLRYTSYRRLYRVLQVACQKGLNRKIEKLN